MLDTEGMGVFLGVDVGRTAHHGHGLTPDKLKAKFGTVLCRSWTSLPRSVPRH